MMLSALYKSLVLGGVDNSGPDDFITDDYIDIKPMTLPSRYQPRCLPGSDAGNTCGVFFGRKFQGDNITPTFRNLSIWYDENAWNEGERCVKKGRVKSKLLDGSLRLDDATQEQFSEFCDCILKVTLLKFSLMPPSSYIKGCEPLHSIQNRAEFDAYTEEEKVIVNTIVEWGKDLRANIGKVYIDFISELHCEEFALSGTDENNDTVEAKFETIWEEVDKLIRETSALVERAVLDFKPNSRFKHFYELVSDHARKNMHDRLVSDIKAFIGDGERAESPRTSCRNSAPGSLISAPTYTIKALVISVFSSYVLSSASFIYGAIF